MAAAQTWERTVKQNKKAMPELEPSRSIVRETAPLSFGQQRLWFLEQLDPGTPAYHIPDAYLIRGLLDRRALELSLSELAKRHGALRTHFEVVDGEPVQVIGESPALGLEVVDLTTGEPSGREDAALRQIAVESLRPFDLSAAPLCRAILYVLDRDTHILSLVVHHIVSDGWSMKVLFDDLSKIYTTTATGGTGGPGGIDQPYAGGGHPTQYRDFAARQIDGYRPEEVSPDIEFWRRTLDGMVDLDLPTDPVRSGVDPHEGDAVTVTVSEVLTERLRGLDAGGPVSLFMTAIAAFGLLLFRHTGQDDLVLGAPTAGRHRVELESAVGLFLNMIPLRVRLSGSMTFRDLLSQVRDTALDAYAHQTFPFEKLVEELRPERRLDRAPIINAMVNFVPGSWRTLQLGSLSVERLALPDRTARLPLGLYLREQDRGVFVRLVYQTALFRSQTASCLMDQFVCLLDQVAADPARSLDSYSLVTRSARKVLPSVATEPLELPKYETVLDRFRSRLNQLPTAAAVQQGSRVWNYRELAEAAQTVALELQASGVRPGDVVALRGQPGVPLVSGILGVWRIGGVILSIDPELPELRVAALLRQAGARWVLTWDEGAPALEAFDGVSTSSDTTDASQAALADAAYVVFTSGTTGTPKGVVGSHQGLAHFLQWQRHTFDVGPGDRVAQLTGMSFDVLLRDLFLPLTSGATLCFPSQDDRLEPARTLEWLVRDGITYLHAVPTLAELWLSGNRPTTTEHTLRCTFFAGEPLTDRLVRRWRHAFPGSEVVNLYGPTETTLAKCWYRVPDSPLPGVQPLGVPLPQTQILVLNSQHRVCGIREPGEIVIRTPFRALSGFDAEGRACELFVPNPVGDDRDAVYLTGDRGRFCPDGTLEILGRLDEQIKINGVRLDPTEVSLVLSAHPSVQTAVVVAREDGDGSKTLVAYVVSSPGGDTDAGALRSYASRRLPSAMIPVDVVFLSELPLTPNGKIDRGALPAPVREYPSQGAVQVAPRNPVERHIASAWKEVLGIDSVGVYDNFFDLGGHSIAAVRVVNRLKSDLRCMVSLRMLFESPTIVELAASIQASQDPV